MPSLNLLTLPIGNLKDITTRAIDLLNSATWILAEDTRNFKKLCDLLNIDLSAKTLDSFHDHSSDKIEKIISKIQAGQSAVLVSDAGSPIISDPAFPLVKAAVEKDIKIESTPGVSSLLVALELSGLPPHPFCFHGFLPREKKGREEVFTKISETSFTHIFFESPHRIQETLNQIHKQEFDFKIAVARELTKKFEEVLRFDISQWPEFEQKLNPRGEVVLLIQPNKSTEDRRIDRDVLKLASEVLEKNAHPKSVAKLVAKILDRNTKEIYSELSR